VDTRTRTRRDHEKYLTLIDTVALLHQHQRQVHRVERAGRTIEYVEVTPADIETANRLAGEVLGRSLDELPPQTRRVLTLLDAWVSDECRAIECSRSDYRFTTREVRDALELGQTQAKIHLARLVELEYLVVHRAVPGQPHVYALLYQGEGEGGGAFLPGLLDPQELGAPHYDGEQSGSGGGRSGQNGKRSGLGRPPVGARSAPGRTLEMFPELFSDNASEPTEPVAAENASRARRGASHVVVHRNGASA
jgi:hypothetical protein